MSLTHSTAGFIDPGFSGHITLELSNVANLPITLWPGMKVGQMAMFKMSSQRKFLMAPVLWVQSTKASAPTPSKSYLNFLQ